MWFLAPPSLHPYTFLENVFHNFDNTTVAHVGRGIVLLNTFNINISCMTIYNSSKSGVILNKILYSLIANVTIVFTKSADIMEQSMGVFILQLRTQQ